MAMNGLTSSKGALTMDIQALRKDRESCIRERGKVLDEMNLFIASHIGEIRDALTIHESGAADISEDDLLGFVSHKTSLLVSLARERKIEMFSSLTETNTDCRHLDDVLASEYCYKRLLTRGDEGCAVLDTDVFVDIRSGEVEMGSQGKSRRISIGADGIRPSPLDKLFSRQFHTRISQEAMRSYILGVKLEMGIEMFRGLYKKSEEDLRRLSSYRYYKEKGLPALVTCTDLGLGPLENVKAKVSEEIGRIVEAQFSDRKKAFLVNYLLVMFSGVAPDVDLDYFDGKVESYILGWRSSAGTLPETTGAD